MIKLNIQGFSGKMGQLLKHYGEQDLNIELEEKMNQADLIIDFSHHENLQNIMNLEGKAIVIGTTGAPNLSGYIENIKKLSTKNRVFYSANMSIGIYLMRQFIEMCAPFYKEADILISDIHHKHKKDSPSGTSKMLGAGIKAEYSSVRFAEKFGTHSVLFETEFESLELKHEAKNRDIFAINAISIGKWLLKQKDGFYEMKDFIESKYAR